MTNPKKNLFQTLLVPPTDFVDFVDFVVLVSFEHLVPVVLIYEAYAGQTRMSCHLPRSYFERPPPLGWMGAER